MLRRSVVVFGFTAIASAVLCAHAGLRFASPLEGATLGDAPSTIQLTFTERPESALSEIHVVDVSGATWEAGRPATVDGDPLSLSVRVRPLPTGVYTVSWRLVSAVDGHATWGVYAFGVRVPPTGIASRNASTEIPLLEVAARWVLNAGLVLLVGAAFAGIGGFSGPRNLLLATAAWLVAGTGVALLLIVQQRTSGAALGTLLPTSMGKALIGRAVALGMAAAALVLVWQTRDTPRDRIRLGGTIVLAFATLAAIAVHAAGGHAAADPGQPVLQTVAQWAHVAASGVWIGGLAALLLGTAGPESELKARSVRRFSALAGFALLTVFVSGCVRIFGELTSWSEFTTSTYGRMLLVKIGIFWVLASLGALNHWHSVSAADRDLRPLRRIGSSELAFAAAALGAAALLAALAPPASARPVPGIAVSGADFATTVRVSLSAVSNQPGPNRFTAGITDYDSNSPVTADRVVLHFTSRDDPGLPTTSLPLERTAENRYSGSGANLVFDGRWRVTVGIERGSSSVEVPLDIDVAGREQPVAVQRMAGRPVKYTVELRGVGFLRFSPDPERPGPSRLYVTAYDVIQDERRVQQMVVTLADGRNPARELSLRRVSPSTFVADVVLPAGRNTVAAVARTPDGVRLRASVNFDVPVR